jgi:secreted protein with Ig-like and vWFA domain
MAHSPLSLEVLPLHRAMKPGEAGTEFVLVRVRAEKIASGPRPRLTAVLVLDVSGSMAGEPLAQVIASTQRLAEILGDDDALGVVAFSSGARTVSPIRKLDAGARREVHAEVAGLVTLDSTNL